MQPLLTTSELVTFWVAQIKAVPHAKEKTLTLLAKRRGAAFAQQVRTRLERAA